MLRITVDPRAIEGAQYTMTGAKRDAVAALVARGVDPVAAAEGIEAARQKAKATGQKQTIAGPRPRKREADADVLEGFIFDRYAANPAGRVKFADFYAEFLKTLSPVDRQLWTRKRVARALPDAHPSVAGGSNVKYVLGLTDAA